MTFELEMGGLIYRFRCKRDAVQFERLCSKCSSSLTGDNAEYVSDKDGIDVLECQTCKETYLWDGPQESFHERWTDAVVMRLRRAFQENTQLDSDNERSIAAETSPRPVDQWD